MPQTENRESLRFATNLPVEIRSVEGIMLEGRLRDISLNGLSLTMEKLLPVGKDCNVVLILENEIEEQTRLVMPGTVTRAEGNLMAVTFRNLDEHQTDMLRTHILPYMEHAAKRE